MDKEQQAFSCRCDARRLLLLTTITIGRQVSLQVPNQLLLKPGY